MAMILDLNARQERTYHWFTNSKDAAYIAQYREKESTRTIFADDEWRTLQAVKTRHPYATCILMLNERNYHQRMQQMLHAEDLQQLYCIILAASIMIRENSMAIQLDSNVVHNAC